MIGCSPRKGDRPRATAVVAVVRDRARPPALSNGPRPHPSGPGRVSSGAKPTTALGQGRRGTWPWQGPLRARTLEGERSPQEPTMFARALTVALGGLVLVAACGGASRGSRGPGGAAPLRSSDAVTVEDLAQVATSSTLYEALRS